MILSFLRSCSRRTALLDDLEQPGRRPSHPPRPSSTYPQLGLASDVRLKRVLQTGRSCAFPRPTAPCLSKTTSPHPTCKISNIHARSNSRLACMYLFSIRSDQLLVSMDFLRHFSFPRFLGEGTLVKSRLLTAGSPAT
jgi:hypothetical protein